MKRWIVMSGFGALLAAALLTTFAFTGSEPVSTEDFDAIYDHYNHRLDPASFVPGVSREAVVQMALDDAGALLRATDTSGLETGATVGLYTGTDNAGNPVEQRNVRLVVVDNLPVKFPSGPARGAVDRGGQRKQNQLVVFYDAETGEEVEGSISGRWVDKKNP